MAGIIITLIIILYRIPLIHILGDRAIGYYSIALEWYLIFMTLVSYGLSDAVTQMIAPYADKKDFQSVNKIFKGALIYAAIAGGLCVLLFAVFPGVFTQGIVIASESTNMMKILGISILLTAVMGAFHGLFRGIYATRVSVMARQIEQSGVAIFSLISALLLGAAGPALGITAGVALSCIFLIFTFLAYRKSFKRLIKRSRSRGQKSYLVIIRKLTLTLLPIVATLAIYHLSNLTDYAIFTRIMKIQGTDEHSYMILLGLLNGKYEFFISLPLLAANFMAASIIPELTKIKEYKNLRLIHSKISACLRYTMMIIIPCVFAYIVLAEPLMTFFFYDTNKTTFRMLQIGAISIAFYGIAVIANAALSALGRWREVAKNALIAVLIHGVFLFLMLVIFEWRIYAVVISRIIFAAALCILNEHSLRETIGYVQEQKRTFTIPIISSTIMGITALIVRLIFELFVGKQIAIFFTLFSAFAAYICAMIFLGGISEKEMYQIPFGKKLAPFCKKIHLLK